MVIDVIFIWLWLQQSSILLGLYHTNGWWYVASQSNILGMSEEYGNCNALIWKKINHTLHYGYGVIDVCVISSSPIITVFYLYVCEAHGLSAIGIVW